MKLLSPTQNKDLKDEQQLLGIIRTQEINKAEQEARQKLANSQADFQLTLARNRQQWATEEEIHIKRVQEMQQELNTLEVQKLNSLIPFDILKEGTDERMRDAETFLTNLRQREEYAEDLAEKLQDKLDETGQKEQDLLKKQKEIEVREIGLENQSHSITTGSLKLSEEISTFVAKREEVEKDIKTRLDNLSLLEQSLNEKEEELKQVQKINNETAIRLADERGVLDRAWKELERKKAS